MRASNHISDRGSGDVGSIRDGDRDREGARDGGPAESPESSAILRVGSTCWRREPSERVAFLIDGETYFDAVASAIENARRQVLIIGWDVHSRFALRREPDGSSRDELAELLDRRAARRSDLHVYVLSWDFSMIYAAERESMPKQRFGEQTHPRVHFQLDGRHPIGASHHQKIVVVDDAVAFCGGLDLTAGRWDTSEHRADDPRRRQPGGDAYGPFHDVEIAVDGAAAAALGDLARERWRHATDETLEAPGSATGDPWPEAVEPDLRRIRVGIARTQAPDHDLPSVREIEHLLLEACRSARRTIYMESQYLTAARCGEVLEERLAEPDGPEIVVVTRKGWSGWLEETTMGLLRARLTARLRAADVHDRLRILYPTAPGLTEEGLKLHSKLTIVDDRFVRVGSANLANRSMGLDSECDLAIEAVDEEHARAIAHLRERLLAEHLGTRPDRIRAEMDRSGSLVRTIEAFADGPRQLKRLETHLPSWVDELGDEINVLDPERPIEFERLREQFLPEQELARSARGRAVARAVIALVLVLLAAAWHLTPLREWSTVEHLTALASDLRTSPSGPLIGFGVFLIASNVLVPVTALVVTSALVFGWWIGFLVALAASVAASALGYLVGARLWKDSVRRLSGRYFARVGPHLEERGLAYAIAVRAVPVAPFPIVNLVAGASQIRFGDFVLGTILGMTPGMLLLSVFADGAWKVFDDPRPERIALLVGIAAVFVVAMTSIALKRRSNRRSRDEEE